MRIAKLVFLSNELQDPVRQRNLRIPFEFVSYAFTEALMFWHYRNTSTFIMPTDVQKAWGNSVAYGGLFLLNDEDFFIRQLDAYHGCSLSSLHRNHHLDIHHRVEREVTPIHFTDLDDLLRLKYIEKEPFSVTMYVGNQNHPKINQRLYHEGKHPKRIVSGIDKNFLQLYREVHTT